MNKKQWIVLSVFSYLLGFFFTKISMSSKISCIASDSVSIPSIYYCVRGEVFAPFPYLLFGLGFIFMILAWLEPKKK